MHVEVKRRERFNLYEALAQARRDAGESGNLPVVLHRKNNSPWVAVMEFPAWIELYREWEAGRREEP